MKKTDIIVDKHRAGQTHIELTDEQLQALVIGLPWHRIGDGGIIDVI